jgi:hypothetical protein
MARPQGEGSSPFDLMQKTMMSTIARQFGYPASWTPSLGGPAQTALILFKDATKLQNVMLNLNYEVLYPEMEYKFEDFVGLEDAARNTNNYESVVISFAKDGSNNVTYDVRKVKAKYDGKTFIATLEQRT